MRLTLIALMIAVPSLSAGAEAGPAGYWTLDQAREILDRTRHVRIGPDLGELTPGERQAVDKLLAAGRLLHELYLDSKHPQALEAARELEAASPGDPRMTALSQLFYMFRGPVATTLDNRREPFLPVAAEEPGRNVYPSGLERATLETLMARRPELAPGLMGLRTVVRETSAANIDRDLARLDRFPAIETLHPGLRARLSDLRADPQSAGLYAVPYSLHWAPQIMQVFMLLNQAAEAVAGSDPDFAAYLRQRARDLLSDDYEAGDAAWVSGDFRRINAQIGSYESYDDALFGVRTFFSLSLLVRDADRTAELERAIGSIQALQDSLPQDSTRRVRSRIPVGVYDVIADFGQARGTNTATILPNEPDHTRKYGRIILLRGNILTDPGLFADSAQIYAAAVGPTRAADYLPQGPLYRTLWHEIGHYLGVDRTRDGRDLGTALSPWGDLFEELKSDLVSLYVAPRLREQGLIDDATLRAIYASGISRVLQRVEPRREQPYQTMQLMQMNYFLERGLLAFGQEWLELDYEVYHDTVTAMLTDVLRIQADGDPAQAADFVRRYGSWDPGRHGRLAERLLAANPYQFRIVHYQALESP